jgi:8-oxo-dGTP diphosphatase
MTEDRSAREYPGRPIVGVGAVVLETPGGGAAIDASPDPPRPTGVVLIRRRFAPLAGEWSLPGGTVEVGESLEAALAREVLEETGLAVEVGPVVEVFDRIMRDEAERVQYHFVLIDYLCRPIGGHLAAGSDVTEAVVADPGALGPFKLTEKARSVIARALAMAAMMPSA